MLDSKIEIMKAYKYLSIIFSLILLAACDLAKDLDDYEPQNALPAETAVTDQASAELVLTGVYANFLQSYFSTGANPVAQIIPAKLSVTGANGFFVNDEQMGYITNNPIPGGNNMADVYHRILQHDQSLQLADFQCRK